MSFINVLGLRTHYIDLNLDKETALIFIHGNSHSLRTFRHQLSSSVLNEQFRLVALDLPGHGESAYSEVYNLFFFAEFLSEFVKSLKLSSYFLIGHSLGGHIAIQSLKFINPRGLCIFGTPPLKKPLDIGSFKDNELMQYLFRQRLSEEQICQLVDSFFVDIADRKIEHEDFLKSDPVFRIQLSEVVAKGAYEDEVKLLDQFGGAVAILHGKKDAYINQSYLSELGIKNIWKDTVVCSEFGHNFHVEDYAWTNSTIISYIDESTHSVEILSTTN